MKAQTNGSLFPHPFGVEVYDCQFTQGGTPPSPPTAKSSLVGVPRSLDGLTIQWGSTGKPVLPMVAPKGDEGEVCKIGMHPFAYPSLGEK